MDAIGLSDAEGHLSDLVDRVEAGESLDITRDGKAVARLVPVGQAMQIPAREPFDFEALRRLTDSLSVQSQRAGEFVRAMQDAERY